MDNNENRQYPRFDIERTVKIVLSDGSHVDAKMINISADGIAILYPESTKIGTKLRIYLSIPINNDLISMTVDVKVCHVHLAGSNFKIGLQFYNLDKAQQILLIKFIMKKMADKKLSQNIMTSNKLK